jgi:hypothetical protein
MQILKYIQRFYTVLCKNFLVIFIYRDIMYNPQANVFTKGVEYWTRLCGLVVRVSGYKSRGPGFDSQRFQIF